MLTSFQIGGLYLLTSTKNNSVPSLFICVQDEPFYKLYSLEFNILLMEYPSCLMFYTKLG